MGTKFLLSPMRDNSTSQIPEDLDKEMKFTSYTLHNTRSKTRAKDLPNSNAKVGPQKRRTEAKQVSFVEPTTGAPRASLTSIPVRSEPNKDMSPDIDDSRSTQPVNHDSTPKSGPTYKSKAPVELGLDIEKLVETVLDLEINVPLRSLAGVSGAIQKEIRKQVTKTRWPIDSVQTTLQNENFSAKEGTFETDKDPLPNKIIVADDPVLQYLSEHEDAEILKIKVSDISEPLRAVYSWINKVGQEECLLDNGSMIISMAKQVAIQLGLTWDPSIRINMESASNHVEKTLGLARNVHFGIGGLDFFLQVHILENPPYRILLGRPFEKYSKCITQNNEDGSSDLVLTDPNSKRMAIIPTYERGIGPDELQKRKFQSF